MQTPLAAEGIEETIRRAINYFCTPEGRSPLMPASTNNYPIIASYTRTDERPV